MLSGEVLWRTCSPGPDLTPPSDSRLGQFGEHGVKHRESISYIMHCVYLYL